MSKYGILLRGLLTDWTKYIIEEYEEKFPNAEIVVSTWDHQDVSNLSCKTVQNSEPVKQKLNPTINRMIVQIQKGLESMDSEIILQCRVDQFIHNKNIFKIFEKSCKNKIMVPHIGTETRNYYCNDYAQLATKEIINEFWFNMPYFEGDSKISTEEYLAKQYVTKIKHDLSPWEKCQHKYFCFKGFFEDFKLEWQSFANYSSYSDLYLHVKKQHSISYEKFLKDFIRLS